jgi:hypothetical protein
MRFFVNGDAYSALPGIIRSSLLASLAATRFTGGRSALADAQSQCIKCALSLDMDQMDARETATAILRASGLSKGGSPPGLEA